MLTTLVALVIVGGVAFYLMTPEERARAGRIALAILRQAIGTALRLIERGEPFNDMLRERTRWPIVTPLLIATNIAVFIAMVFEPGAVGDPQTLIDWAANYAPRTTNGEWWRLVGATFVHVGMLHLLATVVGLLPIGLVLERLVGHVTFAAIYVAAGILSSVVSLWTTTALSVTAGASGAIFGIYGLAVASLMWGIVSRPLIPIPLMTLKLIAPAAVVFFAYNLSTDDLGTASELAGLATGFVGGLVVARGVTRETPPLPRAAYVAAAASVVAVACVMPMRGIIDVRSEIARVVAVEERTAGAYDAAVVKFRKRRITTDALVQLIDRTIMPELQAARARLKTLRGVPVEQLPLVAAADQYFQLRERSWRRRAEGLLESDMGIVREAEQTERAALEAFRKMTPAG